MVIDTMVFAYALFKVKGKYEESTRILAEADTIVVPDSFRAEMANVTWQWVKHHNVPEASAYGILQDANSLVDRVVSSERIWVQALQLSIQQNHPVYDTLFIAAADASSDLVVTYDKKMQIKFPGIAISPTDFFDRSGNS